MARTNYVVTNLTAGELSPRLDIRVDLNKYRNGAALVRNAVVMPHGGVRKRPGTRFVFEVKDSTAAAPLLVPFQFSTEQSYMLEFGNLYVRFYKDGGVIVTGTAATITGITKASTAVVSTAAPHGYANGQQVVISGVVGMTEVNNRRFTIGGVTANSFQLTGVNSTGYTTYSSGGSVDIPVEVATTYTTAELDDLWFAQSADTLYIAHKDHKLAKLTRSSHVSWTLSDADIVNGPFRSINTDEAHYLSVAVTGSASISGITRANPGVVTANGHPFGEGATVSIASVGGMTQVNGNKYVARNVTANTFELWTAELTRVNTSAFGTYTSGGTATSALTPFGTISPGTRVTLASSKSLFTSSHVEALFRLWEPGKTTGVVTPVDGQTFAEDSCYTSDGKVYGARNVTTGANPEQWRPDWQRPSHERGVVRIIDGAGDEFHDSVYLHDSSCVLEIVTVSSATSATARVVRDHVPKSVVDNRTSFWEEGSWSGERGYPGVITFHESRLFAAASTDEPQTLWASKTGAFEDFQDGTEDDRALTYTIASEKVDVIKWLSSGKVLLLGTPGNEYAVAASAQNEALTPGNVRIARQTPYGSSNMRPVRVGNALLFGHRFGDVANPARKLRELIYSLEQDAFVAPDLTIVAEHITGSGAEHLTYQANPDSVVWAARSDGLLPGLTYEREQDVVGWHLQELGGTAAVVERLAVIPGTAGDDLWMITGRTIGGGTKQYIEYMTSGLLDDMDKAESIYLDCSATYEGVSTSTITGLWHLEGEEVDVLNNGVKEVGKTVSSGSITLDAASAGGPVHVGKKYRTIIETLDLEAGALAGAAKSRSKRINKIFIDVHRSLGGTFGYSEASQRRILYRTPDDPMGTSPDLKSGLVPCSFPNRHAREARVRIEHDEPYPFTLLGVVVEIHTVG